jgi:hypothetical protein
MDGGSDPRRAASTARKGTASEIHPMHQTIIFASDAVVAMLLGFISGSCYLRMMHAYTGVNLPLGPLWREVMLGSVISALVMRESRLGHNRYDIERAFRYQLPIARGAIIVIVLFCIGLLTRSLHDLGGLWLLSWAALLASWIGLSRLGLSRRAPRAARAGGGHRRVRYNRAPGGTTDRRCRCRHHRYRS